MALAQAIATLVSSGFPGIASKSLSFDSPLADTFHAGELVVNATPVGMKESGDLLPVPAELMNERHFVYDLIYTPLETALIRSARSRGARAASGLGMLLHQAALAFTLWTGVSAPIEAMRQALLEELECGDRPGYAEEKDRGVSS